MKDGLTFHLVSPIITAKLVAPDEPPRARDAAFVSQLKAYANTASRIKNYTDTEAVTILYVTYSGLDALSRGRYEAHIRRATKRVFELCEGKKYDSADALFCYINAFDLSGILKSPEPAK